VPLKPEYDAVPLGSRELLLVSDTRRGENDGSNVSDASRDTLTATLTDFVMLGGPVGLESAELTEEADVLLVPDLLGT
jgi:hypothetical protein